MIAGSAVCCSVGMMKPRADEDHRKRAITATRRIFDIHPRDMPYSVRVRWDIILCRLRNAHVRFLVTRNLLASSAVVVLTPGRASSKHQYPLVLFLVAALLHLLPLKRFLPVNTFTGRRTLDDESDTDLSAGTQRRASTTPTLA